MPGVRLPEISRHEMLRLKQLRDMGHGVCVAPDRAFAGTLFTGVAQFALLEIIMNQ